MRPRSLPAEFYVECESVARQRSCIPTDLELATKHGTSRGYVRTLIARIRKKITPNVPHGTSETQE